jgi:YD repeat-containing protein
VAIEHPDNSVTSYAYNGDGLKIEKDDGTAVTRFLYDGNNLLRELDDIGTVKAATVAPVLSRRSNRPLDRIRRDALHAGIRTMWSRSV